MLLAEKPHERAALGHRSPGVSGRTTTASYLRIPTGYLPNYLQPLLEAGDRFLPWLFTKSGVQIGPIPAGAPVDLLANLQLVSESTDPAQRLDHDKKLFDVLLKIKRDLKNLPRGATDEQAHEVFKNVFDPLFQLSKCSDLVVNRGHYFGTSYDKYEPALSDGDKRALIEFLKTF